MKKKAILAIAASLMATCAMAYYTTQFGSKGYSGETGQSGYSGQSGQSTTVFASSQFQTLNLDGTDGGDGYDGRTGESAKNCYQQKRSYNLRGAPGGDGGSGGSGGSGGNGGDVTIYYTDAAQLKNIMIQAQGGRGGRAGYGADGGYGCRCSFYQWHVNYKCDKDGDGKKNEKCRKRYQCYDGRNGSRGSSGYNGSEGRDGSITLIQQDSPLENTTPSYSNDLRTIEGQEIQLSRHLWSYRSGALGLLANGSRLSDSYTEYERTIDKSFKVNFSAATDLSQFDLNVSAGLNQDRTIDLNVSGDVIYTSTRNEENDVTVMNIDEIYKKSTLRNFSFDGVSGSRKDTVVRINDNSGMGTFGSIRVFIEVESGFFNKDYFEGYVSSSYVDVDQQGISIRIGDFVEKARKRFKSGKKIRLEIKVERTWAGQTVKKHFEERKVEI